MAYTRQGFKDGDVLGALHLEKLEDGILEVQPIAKTEDMTQSVGVDETGALWTKPGGAGGAWSEEKTFVLEEEASSFAIDLGGEYEEVVAVMIYHGSANGVDGKSPALRASIDGTVTTIGINGQGGIKASDGLQWMFNRWHFSKFADGYRVINTYEGSSMPNSVYWSNGTYPYAEYRETFIKASGKMTRLEANIWAAGALFGAGTTVYYIVR